MAGLSSKNVAWRAHYGRAWRWALGAAVAFHAALFFLMPRGIADRLHEALIPPPDVSIVAGAPGTELEVVALAAPAPPAETPPPEPEPVEEAQVPVPAEVPEEVTVAETVAAPSQTEGVEEGVAEGEGRSEPSGGGGSLLPPRPVHLVVPQIPRGVDRKRAHGETVHLLVQVLADGSVGEVVVEKGSRIALLNEAALAAARRTRYVPAVRDGAGVTQWARQEIRF
jgi:protein TonB